MLLLSRDQWSFLLWIVWAGAVVGIAFRVLWVGAPRWLYTPCYLALGWAPVRYLPDFLHSGGVAVVCLVVTGGLLYSVGAVALPRLLHDYRCWRPCGYWAAQEQDTGTFLGWFELRPLEEESPAVVELGYRLNQAAWGHGYATEGAKALVRKGFTDLEVERVTANTMAVNTRSRRVMGKSVPHRELRGGLAGPEGTCQCSAQSGRTAPARPLVVPAWRRISRKQLLVIDPLPSP
ncbi:hemolysin III family protein [Streptomyces sp. NPDC001373]|uniref:hemolysin III family protein n=1 Tax=Streptomyces sp. NPDC001373 TaxID=3364565 RepID=UPI0036C0F286